MIFAKSSLLVVAMLGASMVNAHMIMSEPVPYSKDTLNNSPLAADGSDFPCKLRPNAFQPPTTPNVMKIGQSQPLRFIGSATHGGGSCQISLTTDLQPSKSTSWRVIKTFEGGCPANVDGNLSGSSTTPDPFHFNFTIPEGISPGKYTLAWTWFNRIGNREMYMNCAPITVTGGYSKHSAVETEKRSTSFPPMFVANINGCTTKEGIDIRFPQPGEVIEYDGNPANLAPKGQPACTGTPTFAVAGESAGGSSSSDSSSSSSSSAAGSAPTATSSEAPAPVTSQVPLPPPSTTTAPEPISSSAPASVPHPTSSSTPSITSTSGAFSGSCSPDGLWNCISGTSFQRCASGQWSVEQQMASGTVCAPGQSSMLSVSASKKARMFSAMRSRKQAIARNHPM